MTEVDKLPPHDIDAEESTVGCLLIDGAGIDNISFLAVNDFYHEQNRDIFKACVEVNRRGDGINQITIAQELNRNGRLEPVGGAAYLTHIISMVGSTLDLVHYANIVQRLSVSRQLIDAGREIERMGFRADPDPGSVLNEADGMLLAIRKKTVGSPIINPEERAARLSVRYESLFSKEQGVAIKTGISSLDFMVGGGLFKGEFIILAARPGMGKTALAQTVANNVGRVGKNVLYCSVEMGWESLSDRDMAGMMKVPISTIRLGGYEDDLYAKMSGEGLEAISKLGVYIYDDNPITTSKILIAGMEMTMRHGLGLIVIDYIGIVGDDYGRSPYERIGFISRQIKMIARVLDVPILALHQLSRGVERREEKRPELSDLRDSGQLEEDADVVLFMYRENYYNPDHENQQTEIILGKQRQGGNADKRRTFLLFDRESQCYRGIKKG